MSMSSRSFTVLAALMILMALLSTAHCINTTTITITPSSSRCDGGSTDDPSCLIGEIIFDSEEFMMESEISRRILAGNSPAKTALNPAKALSCDRSEDSQCHSGTRNGKPPPPNCAKATYNRECHRYN
ncbi:hypothetical protein M0R45_005996 [Rubus argutus]|uniref:Uncharacterized protein n=1 Tax=Rubus argutus TaxID=59490 RepID=A0AAW1YP99_RUBAR